MLSPSYDCPPTGAKVGTLTPHLEAGWWLRPVPCALTTVAPCHFRTWASSAPQLPPLPESLWWDPRDPDLGPQVVSTHTHTLDTSASASANGPRAPGPLQVCQHTRSQPRGILLARSSSQGENRTEDPSNRHLQGTQKPSLPVLPRGGLLHRGLQPSAPFWPQSTELQGDCSAGPSEKDRCCSPPGWHPCSHLLVKVFSH